ncbi:uncharacterized protein LOC133729103 isoform X2 [Rosa rugosa]|uniref:uncharacterized protein LOC133729103 isoform X2 n=1 Tax=Rosa rugosa TaxID=74645 RepID=UPI002B40D451|nr:uncharacterized protein LOC133729103 isoform X2 [Rosa rugosa]
MANGRQGPRFLHQLRTNALPQHQMRSSTQKISKLAKSLSKPTTPAQAPAAPLHSSVEQIITSIPTQKISKLAKSLSKPTTPAQAPAAPLHSSVEQIITSIPNHVPKHHCPPQVQSSPLMRMLRSTSVKQGSTSINQGSTSIQQESTSTANATEPTQVACSPTVEEITNTNICKKVRGETRCLELSKRKRDGVQLDIDIPKHTMRAVGTNCQFYITGMGCFVRKNVPLQIKKWSELSREDVALLIRHAREKFKLSNESHVDEAIEKHMMRYFTTWRYNLRKKFLKYDSIEEAVENRPEDVEEEDWNYLIANLWQDGKWLETSEKNRKNRDKLEITHCAGTKAFSRLRTENRNLENGEEVGRIDLFKLTRYSEKKSAWVGDTAKNAFEEMKNLQNEPQMNEETGEIMSEDEIYDKVLSKIVGPPRSGYIRGLGAGPKPKRSKLAANDAQLREANQRADQAERRAMQLAEELMAVKSTAAQQNEELKTVKAGAAQQNEELEAVKARATQQNEELEALKARQNQTDTLLLKLMAQLSQN